MTDEEAKLIKSSPESLQRVKKSYKMMLGFYGFELKNEETGEIGRSLNYRPRFSNFERHGQHNCMRITRILTSLGELGYPHYKKPFISHIMKEVFQNGQLGFTIKSLTYFWIPTLDPKDRPEFYRDLKRNLQ